MKNRCEGCGIKIQTTNPLMPGYIDSSVYLKNPDNFLCQRCFNLKHYNITTESKIDENKFYENIKKINKKEALIVYLVDLLDLEGSLVENINDLFPNQKILMVVNKIDLFNSSIKPTRIKNYITLMLKEKGIKVSSIQVVSCLKEQDVIRVFNEIVRLRNDNDVYVFGMTNVGKSTFINELTHLTLDKSTNITTSNLPSTTLDFIKIALPDKTYLYDMPGIINPNQFTYYLDKDTINKVLPKKVIKPKVFQLNPNQSIFVGGFCWFNYLGEDKITLVTNFSNELVIHRTKLDNANLFYEAHKDDLLIIPNNSEREKLGKLKKVSFDFDGKVDVCVSGLGFISLHGKGKVEVNTFEVIKVQIRDSLI